MWKRGDGRKNQTGNTFGRDQMGVGAASAVMIFMTVAAIIVPYLYSDIRRAKHEG